MQDKHDMPLITADDTVAFSFFKRKYFSFDILQITMCLANLMMSGSATPYLHNGIMDPGEGDDPNFDVSLLSNSSFPLDVKLFCSMETERSGSRAATRLDCLCGKLMNI